MSEDELTEMQFANLIAKPSEITRYMSLDCDEIHLVNREIDIKIVLTQTKIENVDCIVINGIRFKKEVLK